METIDFTKDLKKDYIDDVNSLVLKIIDPNTELSSNDVGKLISKSPLNDIYYLEQYHKKILEVYKNVFTFFRKNRIHCFPAGGTLLGLVRERQLIKGDDDIDISVDYGLLLKKIDKFNKYLNKRGLEIDGVDKINLSTYSFEDVPWFRVTTKIPVKLKVGKHLFQKKPEIEIFPHFTFKTSDKLSRKEIENKYYSLILSSPLRDMFINWVQWFTGKKMNELDFFDSIDTDNLNFDLKRKEFWDFYLNENVGRRLNEIYVVPLSFGLLKTKESKNFRYENILKNTWILSEKDIDCLFSFYGDFWYIPSEFNHSHILTKENYLGEI